MQLRIVAAVILALAIVATSLGAAAPAAPAGFGKYQDIERAEADGYMLASPCVPGMGYHYVNFELAADSSVKVSEPEALVYAHGEDGLELVAIEYISDEEFELLGTHSHEGPAGQAIHAWFFLPNPDGLTADFNPHVDNSCNII